MNVTRESHIKVLGRWVRVPNWMITQKWSAERIAREELRAQQLGDLQNFVMKSPLFPIAVVAAFFGFMYFVCWAVPALVDTLL